MKNYRYGIVAYRELAESTIADRFAIPHALYAIGSLYQREEHYYQAIAAYDELLDKVGDSKWRDEPVYQRAVCYQIIRWNVGSGS